MSQLPSLYKITTEFQNLLNDLIDSEGELTPEMEARLAISQEEIQEKGVNYGLIIRDLQAKSEVVDREITRLATHKKRFDKAANRLRDNIAYSMKLFNIEKIESPLIVLSFRKSKAVEITGEVDKEYCREIHEFRPDKAIIKMALNAGKAVTGAKIIENKNLQIR